MTSAANRRLRWGAVLTSAVALSTVIAGQPAGARPGLETIRAAALKGHLYFLASDELGGRQSLSPEGRVAADYIAGFFHRAGLKAVGAPSRDPVLTPYRDAVATANAATYFQDFPMVEASLDQAHTQLAAKTVSKSGDVHEREYTLGSDFSIGRHWNTSAAANAPLVFAGYGISAPEYGYDDFAGVDVAGKVVLVLSREPQADDPQSRFMGRFDTFHSYNFYKEEVLRRRGAAATLVVGADRRTRRQPRVPSGPTSGEIMPATLTHTLTSPYYDVPMFSITRRVADELLAPSWRTVDQLQADIDRSGRPASMPIPGVTVAVRRPVLDRKVIQTRNVIGVLEGSDPKLRDEYVLITGHYDHSGRQGPIVFHGADDNASATAAVIAMAEAFAANAAPPRRSVMFIAFDAEENGLLGSYYYVEHPVAPLKDTVAVLNMDMIGRDEESATWNTRAEENRNSVNVIGTLYNPDLRKAIDAQNQNIRLTLDYKTDADDRENWFARSDHLFFATRSVPMVLFSTGEHPDYHTPNDTWDRINYPKMEKIVRLIYLTAYDLANAQSRPQFVTDRTASTSRSR
jgi:Peptidase family M28/PA domain